MDSITDNTKENEQTTDSGIIKLWNPNAAANLALLFSPIFSAWLHSKNWHELGKPDEAKKSMMWVKLWIGFLPVYLLLVVFAPKFPAILLYLFLLIAWYYKLGKVQVTYVKDAAIIYEKKLWSKPILIGIAASIMWFMISAIVGGAGAIITKPTNEILEAAALPALTQYVSQAGIPITCDSVSITGESSDGIYDALANMSDGSTLRVQIERKGQQIFVNVLME